MKLRTKILALSILPFLVIISLISLEIRDRAADIANSERISDLSHFSTEVSALIHEVQKERGESGLFMGSNGEKFERELMNQRKLVDRKKIALKNFLIDFQPEKFSIEFKNKLNAATLKLDEIDEHREKVSSLAINNEEGINFYNNLNALLLDNIFYISNLHLNPEVMLLIESYTNFLRGKEYAGLERALGTSAFSRNRLDKSDYDKYFSIIVSQDIYFDYFKKFATKAQLEFFNEKMSDQSFAKARELRNILLEKSAGGDFEIDAGVWYDLMTTKINLLKEVEDKIVDDLNIKVDSIERKARGDLLSFLLAVIVVFTIISALSILIILSITRSMNKLKKGVEAISSGDLDFRIEMENHDEIGQVGGLFNKMGADLKESKLKLEGYSRGLEQIVNQRTFELQKKLDELKKFKKLTIERELKMVELKKRIAELGGGGEEYL